MKAEQNAHHIKIEQADKTVQVTCNGHIVAESNAAVKLHEPPLDPAVYIPRDDVDMTLLTKTDKTTHCPFKGDASYFSITVEGKTLENAVWSYETPKEDVAPIKDHLSFYTDKVDISER